MTDNIEDLLKGADRKKLVEMLELTRDLATAEDTKFHLYEPTTISHYFHASSAKVRFLCGGNRASKTFTHMIDYAYQFTGIIPSSIQGKVPPHRADSTRRLRLCMGDYPNSFMKVIWPYVKQLIPEQYIVDVVKENGRVKSIVNKDGGFIEFMQYDQDVTKFQGSSRHSIGYDEEPPEDIRDENLMRLVDTDGEETFSLTPVSGAMKYLYDKLFLTRSREVEKNYEFILDKNGKLVRVEEGEVRDVTIPGGDKECHCFFACIFDNPVISKEAGIRILSKFPKEEMLVRGKGHFLFLSGLVYKEYSDNVHLINNFTDWHTGPTARDYTLYVAIDPHPRTPHAALFLVARRDGMLFVVDEMFEEHNAQGLADRILEKCAGRRPEIILIDPLANTPDPSSGSCLTYDLIDAGLNDPMPMAAPRNKSHGIMKVRDALRPNDAGVPRLLITDNCTRFRYEITHWAWDEWRKDVRNTKGDKQKPIDKDDHMLENLYRIALLEPRWVPEGVDIVDDDNVHYNESGRNKLTGY